MSVALRVILPFALTYLLSYAARSINAVAGEPISADLGLSTADLGFLTSVYLAGFALWQLPLGVMMDRYGPRRVEGVVLLLAVVGCVMFAMAGSFAELAAGRFLMGLGFSMCLMAPFTAYRKWFSPDKLPMVVGFHMAFGALGSALAGRPAEMIMMAAGWRTLFLIVAVLTAIGAAAIVFIVPSRREPSHGQTFGRMTKELGAVIRSRYLWRIAPMAAMTQTGFIAIVGLWTGPWLREAAGLSASAAATWLSITAVGLLVGFIGTGFLAGRAERAGWGLTLLIAVSFGYSAVLLAIIVLPPSVAIPLWIPYSMLSAGGITSFSIITGAYGPDLAGRVNTTLNCLIFILAFMVQWLFGVVLGFFPAAEWGATRLGYQVALGGLLALQLLSYLPLLLRAPRPSGAGLGAGAAGAP
ncbi:MAG: MFS transporter [Acuticoccus sp.]